MSSFSDRLPVIAVHLQISKAMHHDEQPWHRSAAMETCTEDWLGDVARFGGSAAINAWFAKVKRVLIARSKVRFDSLLLIAHSLAGFRWEIAFGATTL